MQLNRRRALGVLSAGSAALLARPAAAQVVWLKVEGPDRAFTFELPGTPEHKIVKLTAPGTTIEYDYHSFLLQRGPIQYVLQSSLSPLPPKPENVRKNLQESLDGTARSLVAGKWQQVEWKTVGNDQTVEALGAFDDRRILRYFLLVRGQRFVMMGLAGPVGSAKFPDTERFFKSLKFTS